MNQVSWRRPKLVVNLCAMLTAATLLAIIGGTTGILFSLATAVAWLAGPPVFAFLLAQAGVAALSEPGYLLGVVGIELALLTLLLSDPQVPWTWQSRALAVGVVGLLVGGLWVARGLPVWVAAIGSLLGLGLCMYGVHRYELLATKQLQS